MWCCRGSGCWFFSPDSFFYSHYYLDDFSYYIWRSVWVILWKRGDYGRLHLWRVVGCFWDPHGRKGQGMGEKTEMFFKIYMSSTQPVGFKASHTFSSPTSGCRACWNQPIYPFDFSEVWIRPVHFSVWFLSRLFSSFSCYSQLIFCHCYLSLFMRPKKQQFQQNKTDF